MKKISFEVTYKVELHVNEKNIVVKDYESENELILHVAEYMFSPILPVIETKGVKLNCFEVTEIN